MEQDELIRALVPPKQAPGTFSAPQAESILKGLMEPFGQFGRVMTGQSENLPLDVGELALNAIPPAKAIMMGPLGLAALSKNRGAAAIRQQMEDILGGLGKAEAWKQQKLFRDYSGGPRLEVPDTKTRLTQVGPKEFRFDNPYVDVHRAYDIPYIKAEKPDPRSPVIAGVRGSNVKLYANPEDIAAGKNIRSDNPVAAAAHEIGHITDAQEGAPIGFNMELAPFTEDFYRRMGWNVPSARHTDIPDILSRAIAQNPQSDIARAAYQTYLREAGENSAENVANRFLYPQVYPLHPESTMRYPYEQQFDARQALKDFGAEIPGWESSAVLGKRFESRWSTPQNKLFTHELLDRPGGEVIGRADFSTTKQKPGYLSMDWIGSNLGKDEDATGFEGANTLGYRHMRELMRDISKTYPEYSATGGHRVSGARLKAGKFGDMELPLKPGGLIRALGIPE